MEISKSEKKNEKNIEEKWTECKGPVGTPSNEHTHTHILGVSEGEERGKEA